MGVGIGSGGDHMAVFVKVLVVVPDMVIRMG